EFSQTYLAGIYGQVRAAVGDTTELAGGTTANSWQFTTTAPTYVAGHSPQNYDGRPALPADTFAFYFNNPLADGQDVAAHLKIDPVPQGYVGQLQVTGNNVYTDGIKLL